MLAPVVIFVYNRPNHTRQTIETLAENHLANETDVVIFSDGKKIKDKTNKVEETRAYIDTLQQMNLFKSVTIYKSNINKGLANSVISGVTQIFNKHEKVIVLEDDLVTDKNFLEFMNNALDFYDDYKNIWSISGYNIPIEVPKDYTPDVYISYRSSSWGWATWKERWKLVDWEVKDYKSFKVDRMQRLAFNKGGSDLSYLLDDQMAGKVDSWAIRWYFSQYKNQMYTIYPVDSLVKNIGLDGSGTHSGVNHKYHVNINKNKNKNIVLVYPEFEKRILKKFKSYYLSFPGKILRVFSGLKEKNNTRSLFRGQDGSK